MVNQWTKIFIKPGYEGQTPEALDSLLMGFANAGITQAPEQNGRRPYQLDDQGRYEVRIHDTNPMTRGLVDGLIEHEGFKAVEEQVLEGFEVVRTVNLEGPQSSGSPERGK